MVAGDVREYGERAEPAGNLRGRHQGGPAQAYGLVEIPLQVVHHNGEGRIVGRHVFRVLEYASADPSRFLLDEVVVGLPVEADLPVEDIGYPINTKRLGIHGR